MLYCAFDFPKSDFIIHQLTYAKKKKEKKNLPLN